ncbi:ferredoxin [Kitasatospora viridis]|uniref:Ferredoxin n=1 Tax=Kitasatospora viridis TaxID=281105 RepID=A0A561T6D1_9ACTN|nr:ferredoxin [Kitasatospora viridis]TWF82668.1 ferredoxin [Kitasatospora viridis]
MTAGAEATRVVADPARCIGSGQCVLSAPAVFAQHPDDGRVLITDRRPAGTAAETARQAAQFCPVQAIRLIEPERRG